MTEGLIHDKTAITGQEAVMAAVVRPDSRSSRVSDGWRSRRPWASRRTSSREEVISDQDGDWAAHVFAPQANYDE